VLYIKLAPACGNLMIIAKTMAYIGSKYKIGALKNNVGQQFWFRSRLLWPKIAICL